VTAPTIADLRTQARRHRTRLAAVTVVAVTGSCGKTTTKELTAAVLSGLGRGTSSTGSDNCGDDVARDLLSVRPDDRYYVQELGAWGPGTLDAGIDLVRPDLAVVTNLRNDHYSAFHGPAGARAEKGKLVACLPPSGHAVLNADDPGVRQLADRSRAPVAWFGRDRSADLRATEVSSAWPEPLSFRAYHRGRGVPVRTRLHGEHLLGSALAAIAVGLLLGRSLEQAATALAAAEPPARRMTAVTGADQVTFVRDDFKAPVDSIPEVIDFLNAATADRRLAVFGRISDYPGRSRRAYSQAARLALTALDGVVFVGRRAVELWGERTDRTREAQDRLRREIGLPADHGPIPGEMYALGSVADASRFLSGYLRGGDLVLLKGSGPTDHLERIMLSRYRPVTCWRAGCGRTHSCDGCELLAPEPR
jgi:UDP-N-acetylmuramoyl-tripeptide--D-alanyl-D-alanine ligase